MPMQIVENPNASSRLFGALGSGLGEGLAQLAKHKIGEIQQQKTAQNFQKAFNVSPDYAQALAQLQQSDPGSFHHFVSQLGGGTPPGQALPEGQEPKYNTFQPGGAKQEDKETRKRVNDLFSGLRKKYEANQDLKKDAVYARELLEKEKDNLPGFATRHFNQERNPVATPGVVQLQNLYKGIVSKVAAANAAGSGFRSGKALTDLADRSKAALSQPYETQASHLDRIIKEGDEIENQYNTALQAISKNNNKVPLDLEERLLKINNPLQAQQQQPEQLKVRTENGQKEAWDPVTNKWRKAAW